MRIRNDVVISKNKGSKDLPWLVRWWGKYDLQKEKQPRYSKSFKTKKLAERFAQSLKDDIKDGISVEPKRIMLGSLCKKFIEAKRSSVNNETLKTYIDTIGRLGDYFGSYRNIKSIGKEDAELFINDIKPVKKDTLSDSTKAKHLRNSKLIFNTAISWNYLRNNPFTKISLGNINKEDWHYITPAEFKSLLNAVENIPIRKGLEKYDVERKVRLKAFYSVMYGCGLRFGEAVNLMWDNGNIDFINSKINITNRPARKDLPPFNTKNYQHRTIPCPNWVLGSLSELRKQIKLSNPFVFLTKERLVEVKKKLQKLRAEKKEYEWKNTLMLNNVNRDFEVQCRHAGIFTSDKLSVHCLRKGYGTNLANLSTPVHTLKSLMGHSNIQTTMEFYIHNSDENMKKAIEGLERLVG